MLKDLYPDAEQFIQKLRERKCQLFPFQEKLIRDLYPDFYVNDVKPDEPSIVMRNSWLGEGHSVLNLGITHN